MTRTIHRISSALVLISALALSLQIQSVKADDQFLLEMEVDKSLVAAGENIVFTLTLRNVGVENVTLAYGLPLFDLACCAAGGCYRWSDGKYFVFIVLELKLEIGEDHTEPLEWNLCRYKEGRYVLPEPGKYNLSGVCLHAGAITPNSITIIVIYSSDLNKDLKVDIQDITMVAAAYNTRSGDEKWNAITDLDRNGLVNILDISMVARDYGKTV